MCGIIAYIGKRDAVPVLMEGLRRLEYRGYDSCGIAVMGKDGLYWKKTPGRIAGLQARLDGDRIHGSVGIGHTRWATHGAPTEENAHPHFDCGRKIFVIHNGIIENFSSLKRELTGLGHRFASETDTEVLAHLIEENYQGDILAAVTRSLNRVRGTFGIAVLHVDEPDRIILARRGSPLVIGLGKGEMIGASDVSALLRHTDQVIYLNDNELAVLHENQFRVLSFAHEEVHRLPETVEWQLEETDKNGFPHYMLKEIFEQPETVRNAIRGRLLPDEGVSKLGGLEPVLPRLKRMKRLIIVSCGTSYHAGILARYIFERFTDLDVEVEIASEFRYRSIQFGEDTVVLAVSQSGETADTIAAIREAKRKGALVLGLVNVVGSTIARETEAGIYNHAGPEIGVASTKIFTSQVVTLTLLALLMGRFKKLSMNDGAQIINALQRLPDQIQEILAESEKVRRIAKKTYRHPSFLFLGRMFNYPTALEGALKLKEVSYIHAEGYAAGEMKHGPIALISAGFPVVTLVPRDSIYDKMLSNIKEIEARKGCIIAVCTKGDDRVPAIADHVMTVPETLEIFNPVLCSVPLQLLAYYCALYRGCEIDKPRNLAKSVTVE
ncbi:MAG: glutamine--fructose-6-phosphate transaminase (isomerizing) [Acidobacteria bacterium]|nr:glutamine--fructose-6-phosphate transaminase (isomerizing) [Acidobacteriota bacterium]